MGNTGMPCEAWGSDRAEADAMPVAQLLGTHSYALEVPGTLALQDQ